MLLGDQIAVDRLLSLGEKLFALFQEVLADLQDLLVHAAFLGSDNAKSANGTTNPFASGQHYNKKEQESQRGKGPMAAVLRLPLN